jgi:hypothetical protein
VAGRPLKNYAEYFTHDRDMRNDEKIRAVRRRFGHLGYSIWCMTLEKLTNSEAFCIIENDVNTELLAADFDIDASKLTEIWDYMIEIDLLQRATRDLDGNELSPAKIQSRRLIERFNPLIAKRMRDLENIRQRELRRMGIIASEKSIIAPVRAIIASENTTAEESRGEESKGEQSRAPTASSPSTDMGGQASPQPAAAAPFLARLKKSLEEHGRSLSASDLDAVASRLIASSVEAELEPFIAWAAEKSAKARQSGTWIVKGVLEWGWVAQFRERAPTSPIPKAHADHLCPDCGGRLKPPLDGLMTCIPCRKDWRIEDGKLVPISYAAPPPAPPEVVDNFEDDIPAVATNEKGDEFEAVLF